MTEIAEQVHLARDDGWRTHSTLACEENFECGGMSMGALLALREIKESNGEEARQLSGCTPIDGLNTVLIWRGVMRTRKPWWGMFSKGMLAVGVTVTAGGCILANAQSTTDVCCAS